MATAEIEPRLAVAPVYDAEFFAQVNREGLSSARVIAPLVRELIPCDSVVDVGCGHGAWLSVFQELGANRVIGYDGAYIDRSQLLIPRDCFHTADLSRQLQIEDRFDLAICLEVGEHLSGARAAPLVQALCQAAPVVLFSAAIPGQGGRHHINEQWPRYWERLFASEGYVRLDALRPRLWPRADVAWWYKQNAFLYVRSDALQKFKLQHLQHDPALGPSLNLVAEGVFDYHTSLRQLLRALPSAVWRALAFRRFVN